MGNLSKSITNKLLKDIDMQSAKRMHSIKSKKRELRGAQRESKKKVEMIKEVSDVNSHFKSVLSVSPGVKFNPF